jgi:hypothetical protein
MTTYLLMFYTRLCPFLSSPQFNNKKTLTHRYAHTDTHTDTLFKHTHRNKTVKLMLNENLLNPQEPKYTSISN